MPATNLLYNHTPRILNQQVDLVNDTFVFLLTTNLHAPDPADTVEADIDNEVVGNGYSRQTLTGLAFNTITVNDVRWTANNPVFTASGGNLVARRWHLLDTTANLLIAYGLIDDQDVDVTIIDGNTLTMQIATALLDVLNNG